LKKKELQPEKIMIKPNYLHNFSNAYRFFVTRIQILLTSIFNIILTIR